MVGLSVPVALTFGGVTIPVEPHLDVVAVCVGLLAGYATLVRRYGPLLFPRPGQRAVSGLQIVSFVAGVVLLYVAAGAPLHDIADRSLFSAHMVEHLLYALVIPPLLLAGTPSWMARVLLRRDRVRVPLKHLSRPVIAGLAFSVALVALHWPAVIELMLVSDAFHIASHLGLLLIAVAMWMNVASPVPELIPRLSSTGQMLFLFLMTLVPTIPSSFLTFGSTPLYETYTTFAMPWGMTAVQDMRIAGLIMKVGGGLYLWAVIAVLYFRWAAGQSGEHLPADLAGRSTPPQTADQETFKP